MDLTEALLHRYTNSVVSILNAVRDPDPPTARLGRPSVFVSRSRKASRSSPSPSTTRPPPRRAPGRRTSPERRAHDARRSRLAPRFDFRGRSHRTHPSLVPPSRGANLPHVVDCVEQGPQSGAGDGDPSAALGSLKDLLPALAALAPAGASRLVDALLTWYHQHRRAVQQQTGSVWHARVLELAFWHAAHSVLSPLPPRALRTRDVALVADAAFEAILNTTAPAPHWARWGTDAGLATLDDAASGRASGREGGRGARGGGSLSFDDENETFERASSAGHDAYPDAYASRAARARDPAAPARLCPSPPASELAARCLGLASRHDPAAAAEKFARELAPRTEGEHKRAEAHAVIYGARYLRARDTAAEAGASSSAARVEKGEVSAETASAENAAAALRAAATTLRLLNPVSWAPSHRKSDLRHALCALLRSALAPAAGARLPERAPPEARAAWAEAVSECRADVAGWIRSKEKKHSAAGLPLLGALHAAEALCGGGGGGEGMHAFMDTTLLKALREGKHRAPAVDALRAAIEGIAPPLPPDGAAAPVTPPLPAETGARLRVAMAAAAAAVKRTSHSAPSDPALVGAVARATAAMARVDPLLAADVLLDLTREAKVSDALAAGLAALPDVLALTARRSVDVTGVDREAAASSHPEDAMESLLRSLAREGASADASAGWSDRVLGCVSGAAGSGSGSAAAARAAAAETASSLPRELRKRLSGAARALQSANPADEGAAAVAVALLRCAPFAMPEEWRGAAAGQAVPPLCAHPHAAVRRAAAHAARRIVVAVPAARDAITQQLAAVTLRAPTISRNGAPAGAPGVPIADADVAAGAARALRGACAAWRRALNQQKRFGAPDLGAPGAELPAFDALRPEAACLLLLCSPSARARGAAAGALGEIAALSRVCSTRSSEERRNAKEKGVDEDASETRTFSAASDEKTPAHRSLFSALESCAGEMLLCALDGAEGAGREAQARGGLSPEAAAAAAAAAGGFAAVARHAHGCAWTSALGVAAARAAAAAPDAATTARAQALQRAQLCMLQEGARVKADAPRAPSDPTGDAFELWRNLACFACAASLSGEAGERRGEGWGEGEKNRREAPHVGGVPDNPLLLPHGRLGAARATPLGARGSQSSLFALLVPCLRDGGAAAAAAAAALARVPPGAAPRLLAALAPLQAEVAGGGAAAGGGTPFDRRSADRELRAHLARLHLRLAISGAIEAAPAASPRASGSNDAETRRTRSHPASPPGAGFDGDAREFSRDAVAARLVAFVDGSLEYARSTAAGVECGPDELARLQFAAAATAAACAPRLAALAPGALAPETRARWWERFAALERANESASESATGGFAASAESLSSLTLTGEKSRRSSLHGSASGYDRSARSDRSFDSERDSAGDAFEKRARRGACGADSPLGALDARLAASARDVAPWGGGGSVDDAVFQFARRREVVSEEDRFVRGASAYGEARGSVDGRPESATSRASTDSDATDSDLILKAGRARGERRAPRVPPSGSEGFLGPPRAATDFTDLGVSVSPSEEAGSGSSLFRDTPYDSTALTRVLRHTNDPARPAALARVAREAMASLLVGPAFDADGGALRWIERRLERDAGASRDDRRGAGARALRNHLRTNPALAHTALDGCYHAHEAVATAHVSALADLYSAAAAADGPRRSAAVGARAHQPPLAAAAEPSCPPAKLVALVLFKLVHPRAATRGDAVSLLRAVVRLERVFDENENENPGGLPEALRETSEPFVSADARPDGAFQTRVSAKLAGRRPDWGEALLVEALERLVPSAARSHSPAELAGARERVLGALAPWVKGVHLPHIAAAGRAERLLRALYSATVARGGDGETPLAAPSSSASRPIESLWFGIGKSPRNVVPALRFLELKGLEECASPNAGSGSSFGDYCRAAKRACSFLARAAPRQTADQLVYAASLRGLEAEYPPRAPRRKPRAWSASMDESDVMSVRSGTERSQSAYSFDGETSARDFSSDGEDADDDETQTRNFSRGEKFRGSGDASASPRVSAPDLAIVLLSAVAAEHAEAFRAHLPVLLHAVTATLAGSPEPTVRAHCGLLLAELARALAPRGGRDAGAGTEPETEKRAERLSAERREITREDGVPANAFRVGGGWHGEVGAWTDAGIEGLEGLEGLEGGGGGRSSARFSTFPRGASASVSPAVAAQGRAAAAELHALLARHGADADAPGPERDRESTDPTDRRVGRGRDDDARFDDASGTPRWSPEAVARLVGLLPDALASERGLREQWADEARRWLLRAASFPLAAASARVIAALRVPLDADAADALLAAACAAAAAAEGGTVARGLGGAFGGGFSNQTGAGVSRDPGSFRRRDFGGAVSARAAAAAADLAGLLLDTLTEMFVLVRGERETVAFAHVFWGAAACLRTMHAPTYAKAARLAAAIAAAWPLDDPSGAAVEILRAAAPAPVGTPLAALEPSAVFAESHRKFRGAKTLAAAAAAAAHEAWLQGVGSPERFADIWTLPPPPATPAPAMCLADLAPLLLKGLARPSCAAHALRALAAIAPTVGVGDAWGGERALALVAAGLVPAALAAAAAAAESTISGLEPARSTPDAIGVGEGVIWLGLFLW